MRVLGATRAWPRGLDTVVDKDETIW